MKKLKIVLGVIVGLFVLGFGILQWRNFAAYKTPIPSNAESIIDINIDKILKTISWNAITNPGYYLQKRKKEGRDTVKLKNGLRIPAHIFIYTIKGDTSNSYYTSLRISNKQNLISYLQLKLNMKFDSINSEGFAFGLNKNKNLAVMLNDEIAVIGWSFGNTPSLQILENIINNKNTVAAAKMELLKNIGQSSHITYRNKKNLILATFKNGEIAIDGNCNVDTTIKNYKTLTDSDQSVLQLSFNSGMRSVLQNKNFIINNNQLEGDSILQYYDGFIGFKWQGMVKQQDSVITYAYNDNFDAIPQTTIEEKTIPGLTLYVQCNASRLYNYLYQKGIINDDSCLNREVFPLYKTYVNYTSNQLIISTNANKQASKYIANRSCLQLLFHPQKLAMKNGFQSFFSHLKLIGSAKIQVSDSKPIGKLYGTVIFKNKHINSLVQIIIG